MRLALPTLLSLLLLGDEDQDRTGLALGRLRFELVEVGRGE